MKLSEKVRYAVVVGEGGAILSGFTELPAPGEMFTLTITKAGKAPEIVYCESDHIESKYCSGPAATVDGWVLPKDVMHIELFDVELDRKKGGAFSDD